MTAGGRQAIVAAGDFTVRGSAATRGSGGGLGQELSASRRALEWRVPYVRLLDASGGSVASFADIGRTYLPDGNAWTTVDVQLLQAVPVVSAVLGPVAGLPAVSGAGRAGHRGAEARRWGPRRAGRALGSGPAAAGRVTGGRDVW